MQKRRMWKVAITYYFMSMFVLCKAFNYGGWDAISSEDQADSLFVSWRSFWLSIVVMLQPSWFLVNKPHPNLSSALMWLVSVPTWSVCFALIYVRITNWLNHFPVLGKRVF
jgi:hypothetical protein